MSAKTPTPFAEQGRRLALTAFDRRRPSQSIGAFLTSRADELLKNLRRAGYVRAFAYAQEYDGQIIVTFDETPAKGDGWAVKFKQEKSHGGRSINLIETDFVYVPDVGAEA